MHANKATDGDVTELEGFLERFGAQFTSVDRVIEEWSIGERRLADRLFHEQMVLRLLRAA
jgi:hypothetical protein